MSSRRLHRLVLGFVVALALTAPGQAAAAPLSISISGNHFVNGAGQTIRLLGVNHPSSEYACVDGYGYNDGHQDDADAAAVAGWNANAVRVPLNEDCWLGIDGQPNSSQTTETLTPAGYREAVESYVAALHAHGLYAILDLHWSAPDTMVASGQQPMPDAHSTEFWTSVATAFKGDPAVVFDVFNEPYSPADPRSGNDEAHPVSWSCWVKGGCTLRAYANTSELTSHTYTAVGMQALVDAIRAAGATQPVLVGGLDYANDLTGWIENAPYDPLNQEAASFHNYMGKTCDNASCWESQVAPVATHVPVVTGEFDEDNYAEPKCAAKTPSTFDQDYMGWADAHGVGYLAWGWWVLSQQEKDEAGCSAFYLLEDYGGTPAAPNGTALHDHLLSLPPGGIAGIAPVGPGPPPPAPVSKPAITLRTFAHRVRAGGADIAFTLLSPETCAGTLSGHTANTYAVTSSKHKRRRISLGSVRFALKAGKAKTVELGLSKTSRRLLAAKHALKVQIVVSLTSAGYRPTSSTHTFVLRAPTGHRHARS